MNKKKLEKYFYFDFDYGNDRGHTSDNEDSFASMSCHLEWAPMCGSKLVLDSFNMSMAGFQLSYLSLR